MTKRFYSKHLKFWPVNKIGFTLIELLVVMAIIGILSTIVVSQVSIARAKARNARRLSDVNQIINLLEIYNSDNGHYPIPSDDATSCGFEEGTSLETFYGYCFNQNVDPCWLNGLCSDPNYPQNLPIDPSFPSLKYAYIVLSCQSKADNYYLYYDLENPINVQPIGEGRSQWTMPGLGLIKGYRYHGGNNGCP